MRAGDTNPELERKLKSLQGELKAKTKAVETLEKSKKELAKKVEEADSTMYSKMVDILQDIMGSVDQSKQKSTTICRDISKPGGCPRAGSCKFLHPAWAKNNKETDCHHWMKGKCRYSEND